MKTLREMMDIVEGNQEEQLDEIRPSQGPWKRRGGSSNYSKDDIYDQNAELYRDELRREIPQEYQKYYDIDSVTRRPQQRAIEKAAKAAGHLIMSHRDSENKVKQPEKSGWFGKFKNLFKEEQLEETTPEAVDKINKLYQDKQ